MRVTIQQPEHMPWLGFFHKIVQADLIVFLDNVQFRKNYFQNRNRIKTANGWSWIIVPVNYKSDTIIKDVTIAQDHRWKKKWWDNIYYSYKKGAYFLNYSEKLYNILNTDWKFLSDFNISLIEVLCNFLGIKLYYVKASSLGIETKGSTLLLEICKKLGTKKYLSGISGRDYLEEEKFEKEKIDIIYQEFHHPLYQQLYEPFEPCMSIIDLMFNYGEKSLDVINGKGVPVMKELFL